MGYWDENYRGDEDDFLSKWYSKIEILKIPEPEPEEEYEECVCGICGYRDQCDSSTRGGHSSRNSDDERRYVKPDILYRMKFPLDVVIPTGLTNKDVLCHECKDWIDFIYKMQSRVGLRQDEIPYYEIARKKSQKDHEEYVKQVISINKMRERELEIIHELRKEIRKLNGSKTSPNKEKLKKELEEISDKLRELYPDLLGS